MDRELKDSLEMAVIFSRYDLDKGFSAPEFTHRWTASDWAYKYFIPRSIKVQIGNVFFLFRLVHKNKTHNEINPQTFKLLIVSFVCLDMFWYAQNAKVFRYFLGISYWIYDFLLYFYLSYFFRWVTSSLYLFKYTPQENIY